MSKAPKIFLSYPASEVKLVNYVSDYMTKRGLETWYAAKNLYGLEFWPKEIVNAIKSCDAFVIFFNERADNSTYIQNEVSIAVENDKPLFCLRLENAEPDNLKIFLNTKQWHDWFNINDDSTLEILTSDILAATSHGKLQIETKRPPITKKFLNRPAKFIITAIIIAFVFVIFRLSINNDTEPQNISLSKNIYVISNSSQSEYTKYAESLTSEIMTQNNYNLFDHVSAGKINNYYSINKFFRRILGNGLTNLLGFDENLNPVTEIRVNFQVNEARENEFKFYSSSASANIALVNTDGEIIIAKTANNKGLGYTQDEAKLKALDNVIKSAISLLIQDLKE